MIHLGEKMVYFTQKMWNCDGQRYSQKTARDQQ